MSNEIGKHRGENSTNSLIINLPKEKALFSPLMGENYLSAVNL